MLNWAPKIEWKYSLQQVKMMMLFTLLYRGWKYFIETYFFVSFF